MGASDRNNDLQLKTTLSLDDLNEKELRTVEMRYLGKTSQEIAKATGYNDVYVRNLFMKGGRFEKAYEDFALQQQQQAKETVDLALNRAREEALAAIERIIALSKEACNEAALFKANEFLLNISGIQQEASLKSFFKNASYEQALKMMQGLLMDLYGHGIDQEFRVIVRSSCPNCDPKTVGSTMEITEKN